MDSIEVMIVQKRGGKLFFLSWVQNGENIPVHTPCEKQAKAIAGCAVRLPSVFAYRAKEAIAAIKSDMMRMGVFDSWGKSYWLKNALILILDENFEAVVDGRTLRYCRNMGKNISQAVRHI